MILQTLTLEKKKVKEKQYFYRDKSSSIKVLRMLDSGKCLRSSQGGRAARFHKIFNFAGFFCSRFFRCFS